MAIKFECEIKTNRRPGFRELIASNKNNYIMQAHVTAITFAVKNLAVTKAFYTAKFGWQTLAENEKVIMLKLDNLVLTLCDELLFEEYTNISNNAQSKSFYITINLSSKLMLMQK